MAIAFAPNSACRLPKSELAAQANCSVCVNILLPIRIVGWQVRVTWLTLPTSVEPSAKSAGMTSYFRRAEQNSAHNTGLNAHHCADFCTAVHSGASVRPLRVLLPPDAPVLLSAPAWYFPDNRCRARGLSNAIRLLPE